MKIVNLMVLVFTLGGLPACANVADPKPEPMQERMQSMQMDKPMAMKMMPEEKAEHKQMQGMHEHMKKMQAQMQQIKATSDPEERKQLMQEHMQSMHKGMEMMQKMHGMDMKDEMEMKEGMMDGIQNKDGMKMMGELHKACKDSEGEDKQCKHKQAMQGKHKAMQEHMGMMKQMIKQMSEHQMMQEK